MTARLSIVALLLAGFLALTSSSASADEGWVIRSFDVTYEIDREGVVEVTEDILVDFGTLERHGIFRDMPTEYAYDDENNRSISVGNVFVDDGSEPWNFDLIRRNRTLQIKIGDADIEISGEQRYRISYILTGALNPFDDHDEFFWNVTGNDWPVAIESASAEVVVPTGGVEMVDCFEGPTGSRDRCDSGSAAAVATFNATGELSAGSGMTLVLGLEKGAVDVAPPILTPKELDVLDEIDNAFDITPATVATTIAIFVLGIAAILRQWWVKGRDRWYGEVWYHNDGENALARRKPLGARETILTEYGPPPLGKKGRPLRPAEIGVLIDESADTLDVTATIIDLAVRKHIRIHESETGGVLGFFKRKEYEIERLDNEEDELLPYEKQTFNALFKGQVTRIVKLSSLQNKFYKDLGKIKEALYTQMTTKNGLFPGSPAKSRLFYRIAGLVVAGAGLGLGLLLWSSGWTLVAVPVVVVGLFLLLMAPAMSSRTAKGRSLYLRALGFRKFMVTAETERQRFAEQKNIFHDYLPYAIIFGCVEKWSKAFEGLGDMDQPDWYVGSRPFLAASFVDSVGSFSSSVSGSIASTPGGSGSSGFSGGGGSSGGGGGGGGGGSW